MRSPALVTVATIAVLAVAGMADAQTPISLDQAMAQPDWIGTPVESAWWAWDSKRVHYTQKRVGSPLRDTFVIAASGGDPTLVAGQALADLDAAQPAYDRRRSRAVLLRNGDVFVRDLGNGALTQVTRTLEDEEEALFSSDGQDVLFRRGSDWWRWSSNTRLIQPAALPRTEKDPQTAPPADALRDHQLRLSSTLQRQKNDRESQRLAAEAARTADPTRATKPLFLGADLQISSSSLSPDGRWLLLVTAAKAADTGRVGKMPKYVTESGYEEVEDVRVRVGHNAPVGQALKLVDTSSGDVRDLSLDVLPGIAIDPLAQLRKTAKLEPLKGSRPVRIEADGAGPGIQWSPDGSQVAVRVRSVDNKDRWIASVDFGSGKLLPLHRLTDSAWINWNFNDFGWLPDNTLWLLSEQSGYSHLYTVAAGGKLVALTQGQWEASAVQWSPDGSTAYFVCNRQRPGDYEVCAVARAGGDVRELTALDGVEDFSLAPDGRQLLVRWSASYTPIQIAVVAASGGAAVKLSDTRSAQFRARSWIEPQFVQVPSRHGAGTVWAKLYRPSVLEPGRKYPVVMFVHGAGYLQNVSSRYPNYFREQMFHNLLVERGYVVLDMDYRASEGYGRDWRTAIYRQMGYPELEDYVDGVDFMVSQQQGDRDQVGIYGGSYGGFMTFMGLFRAPEVFKAGAALRPVSDWASYNHEYTANILNTPELDPLAYDKSSPIEYAQNLRGHLLICHGMIDDNVFYQDSVRLAQRLIEMKKDHWELASYPLERHSFSNPEAWYDEYRRILQLFERTLK